MKQNLSPFKSWSSQAGQQLLARLATKDTSLNAASNSLKLAIWEITMLGRALRAKEGFASPNIGRERQP